MSFDDELRRILDAAIAELAVAARAEAERARQDGVDAGRAQGWEDGREQGLFEGQEAARLDADARISALRQEAEARQTALLSEATARATTAASTLDGLLDGFRAIDRAPSLSEVLNSVASWAGREAPRAAVLLVRGGQLQGWRFVGFEKAFNPASLEAGLSEPGVLADAILKGTAGDERRFAMRLEVAGETVAMLYADGLGELGEHGQAGGAAQRLELLGRHASRALEALTALKAARALVRPSRRNGEAAPSSDEDDADGSAKRYARLLVSEIKLYHEPAVVAGREERDLATRLGGEIARARVLYEQRVPQSVRTRTDYFRDELVRTLANGDASLLPLS